ncbi:hypothetical protein [Trichormus variabilis]|uniref:hypothetical protein n=1 Tax=Anabaena variabilis TaxID=264691 RepID=UPI0016831B54|nr:hypothetical protein [Trichormus variabilis]MBD2627612.1 hypothetical protein [Trichormus variabilis FACHB-164]
MTNYQSPITNHQSPITNHQSPMPNATDKANWPLPGGQRFWILSKLCDLKSG